MDATEGLLLHVADMEYITTTKPKLSSRSLAQSYEAALAHLVLGAGGRQFEPNKFHRSSVILLVIMVNASACD